MRVGASMVAVVLCMPPLLKSCEREGDTQKFLRGMFPIWEVTRSSPATLAVRRQGSGGTGVMWGLWGPRGSCQGP